MKKAYLLGLFCAWLGTALAQTTQPHIPTLRERAVAEDHLLAERFRGLLPSLMRENGVDLWLIVAEEYNEDPVMRTMLPATWLSARRKTILFIFDQGADKGLETLAVARYPVGTLFKAAWNPEQEPDQWKRLIQLIEERKPKRIALNISETYAHADGLSHTEHQNLLRYLPPAYQASLVSGEKLAVHWLETRTPAEIAVYEVACRLAHHIIAEGLSEKVIVPGVTTTDDVVWWYRERVAQLGLQSWFHPTVDVQRPDAANEEAQRSFATRPDGQTVIMPGDLVHMDFGLDYLGMHTDTQELAYVLRPGETEVPAYLQKALAVGNRLQDILTSHFKIGRTGNDVLKLTIDQARAEGIVPQIYSHPVGYHGHAAGPAIGMWDNQLNVPGTGDYVLRPYTAYAIELNAKVKLPEWNGKELRVMLEENAWLGPDGQVRYIDGRQKEILPIPRKAGHLRP
jgi:Xaa-Pro aminopeptidase